MAALLAGKVAIVTGAGRGIGAGRGVRGAGRGVGGGRVGRLVRGRGRVGVRRGGLDAALRMVSTGASRPVQRSKLRAP